VKSELRIRMRAPADRIFNAEVHYPANAPAANQNIVRFTALMNLPP